MAYLKVENLKKNFGATEVLKGVSFEMKKGEVVSLIGSSGGGKTTTLRCLNFLSLADAGKIFIDDELIFDGEKDKKISDEKLRELRLNFGLVFQSFNLFPQYTAQKNVSLPLSLLNESRKKASKAPLCDNPEVYANELLSKVGLGGKENFYPHELSGGQQQRVAIARAMALSPKVLCFDEPTSALDPLLTNEVVRVIKELKEKGLTMLIVTHDMDFAKKISDRVLFLSGGEVTFDGSPEELNSAVNEEVTAFVSAFD